MDYLTKVAQLKSSLIESNLCLDQADSKHRRSYLLAKANKLHLLGDTLTNDNNFYQDILYHQSLTALESELLPFISNYIDISGDLQPLENIHNEACIFCSFHLGSFHAWPELLGKFGVDFTAIVNERSFIDLHEKLHQDMENLRKEQGYTFDFKLLNAESPSIGIQMIREIKNNRSIMIYIDGNTGVGGKSRQDDKLVSIKFQNKKILARKGIAAISHVTKAPIVPLISYREDGRIKLHVLPKIYPDKNSNRDEYCFDTTQNLYELFAPFLRANIAQWEGWLYINEFIDPESIELPKYLSSPLASNELAGRFNSKRYGLLAENDIYTLFDTYTYKAIKISKNLFNYLNQGSTINGNTSVTISANLFNDLVSNQVIIL